MKKGNKLPTISIRLEELRSKKRLIQKEVADSIGIDVKTYGNHERGTIMPSMAIILKYADFYECSVDYLLGRNDYTTIDNANISNITGLSDEAITILRLLKCDDEKIMRENPFQNLQVINHIITDENFKTFLMDFYGSSKYSLESEQIIDLIHKDYAVSTSAMKLTPELFESASRDACRRIIEKMIDNFK